MRSWFAMLCAPALALLFACSGDDPESTTTGAGGAHQVTGAGGDPASTTSSTSSASASASASSSSSSSSSSTASSSSSSGDPCPNSDPGEPNNSEASAYDMGTTGCADGDVAMIYGVLDGAADKDWFTIIGTDDVSCTVNPTAGVKVTGAASARVCAYFECLSGPGDTDIGTCPAGTTPSTSPMGRPGCCGTADFTVDLSCGSVFSSWSSRLYLRVDDPTKQSTCTEYMATFHF